MNELAQSSPADTPDNDSASEIESGMSVDEEEEYSDEEEEEEESEVDGEVSDDENAESKSQQKNENYTIETDPIFQLAGQLGSLSRNLDLGPDRAMRHANSQEIKNLNHELKSIVESEIANTFDAFYKEQVKNNTASFSSNSNGANVYNPKDLLKSCGNNLSGNYSSVVGDVIARMFEGIDAEIKERKEDGNVFVQKGRNSKTIVGNSVSSPRNSVNSSRVSGTFSLSNGNNVVIDEEKLRESSEDIPCLPSPSASSSIFSKDSDGALSGPVGNSNAGEIEIDEFGKLNMKNVSGNFANYMGVDNFAVNYTDKFDKRNFLSLDINENEDTNQNLLNMSAREKQIRADLDPNSFAVSTPTDSGDESESQNNFNNISKNSFSSKNLSNKTTASPNLSSHLASLGLVPSLKSLDTQTKNSLMKYQVRWKPRSAHPLNDESFELTKK